MNKFLQTVNKILQYTEVFKSLEAPLWLIGRIYVANIFFTSGLTKLVDWESTLYLFESEYSVPLLNYEVAAYLGTFGELVFPMLLVGGLFTRLSALGLFVVNLVAVLSLSEVTDAALNQHYLWAVVLSVLVVTGGSKLSFDHLINRLTAKRN